MNISMLLVLLISCFVAGALLTEVPRISTTSSLILQSQSTVTNGASSPPALQPSITQVITTPIPLLPTPSVTLSLEQGAIMTSSIQSSSPLMQPVSTSIPVSTQPPITTTVFPTPTPLPTTQIPSVTTTTQFPSPTPVPSTIPVPPTTPAPDTPSTPSTPPTPPTPPTTQIPGPMQVLRDNLGLIITVGVAAIVLILLTAMCCLTTVCCVCCYRTMRRRPKKGYKRTEVFGDYPEDFNVNTTRFTYQRIQSVEVGRENVEMAMIGAVVEEHRKKILPEHYKKHLDSLWAADFAELREEFDMLEVSKLRQNSVVANLHNEIQKNKDFKLVPYDSNRVKLKSVVTLTSSDYINASFIRAPNIDQLFIAAQAPMEGTVNHFWQSVMEQNISNIVMLVPTGVDQQVNLLPSEANPVKHSDHLELYFEAEDNELFATFRRFKIKNELGHIKHVVHGQFRDWVPRMGVPKFQHSFVKFILSFKQRMIVDNSPVLVYSLTGCGPTGVFIATYTLMQLINMSMPVSVFDTVLRLLEQRVCIVQSLEEYKFLHLTVLELICEGTELLASEFPDAYLSYLDSLRGDSYRSIFHQQFAELDYQVDKTHKRSQEEALNPINRTKNTTLSVLPYDDTRVSLFSEFWESSDYINASYIDGYKDAQYFIATSHPIRETILEFLQMVYQCNCPLVVLLATEDEFGLLQTGLDGSVCYWGDERQGFGMYSVENLGSTNSAGLTRNKIKITNHSEKSSHTFVQYICVNFLDNSKPTNSQAVIHLSSLIHKFKQEYTESPVIVHCWDGIGKTGVLIACCIAIQQLMLEDRVDLFHIVKTMRRGREKMVSPVDLYIACFDIIKDYIIKSGHNTQEAQSPGFTVKVNV